MQAGSGKPGLSIGHDPVTGKLKQISKYFKTRKEGQDWLVENQHNINTGSYVEPDKVTFGDWLKRWLTVYVKPKIRPTSYANYMDVANNHIIPFLGNIPIQALRTSAIQELYNQKSSDGRLDGKGGLSARIIHLIHYVINGALKQAAREKFIHSNPAEYTTRPSLKYKEIQPLTVKEVNRYLETAKDDRLYPAFLLELTTGLRRGELLAITWVLSGTIRPPLITGGANCWL